MWDIGGQESLRKDWSTYYATAEVGNNFSVIDSDMFVFDIYFENIFL